MTIAEMHVWFRQYAQQMGMQNVRAILPEQIDLLINTSITDTINQIITQNIGVTNDRVITDNSKIGQINALRSLYKVVEVITDPDNGDEPFSKGNIDTIYNIIANFEDIDGEEPGQAFDYLYLIDLAINYKTSTNKITNYFPVRLIDDAFLADTLNDFILKPRVRTPIAVIYNNKIQLYINDIVNTGLPQNLTPNILRISYIGKPVKVAYLSDVGGTNVDCDLPEYMHVDILKHAVDLYRISISGALSGAQSQQQAQQQENVRNNYRNDGGQPQQQS